MIKACAKPSALVGRHMTAIYTPAIAIAQQRLKQRQILLGRNDQNILDAASIAWSGDSRSSACHKPATAAWTSPASWIKARPATASKNNTFKDDSPIQLFRK
jgi:hypothetical protein